MPKRAPEPVLEGQRGQEEGLRVRLEGRAPAGAQQAASRRARFIPVEGRILHTGVAQLGEGDLLEPLAGDRFARNKIRKLPEWCPEVKLARPYEWSFVLASSTGLMNRYDILFLLSVGFFLVRAFSAVMVWMFFWH